MSKRKYNLFLVDILKSAEKISILAKDKSYDDFVHEWTTIDAVVRNLEIIGEAVKHLPEQLKEKYRDVEWKKISGLRDILIHEYFSINQKILWDIVKNKVPEFRIKIELIFEKEKQDSQA